MIRSHVAPQSVPMHAQPLKLFEHPDHKPTLRRLNCITAALLLVFIQAIAWDAIRFGVTGLDSNSPGGLANTSPWLTASCLATAVAIFLVWIELACRNIVSQRPPAHMTYIPLVGGLIVLNVCTLVKSQAASFGVFLLMLFLLSLVYRVRVPGVWIRAGTRSVHTPRPESMSYESFLQRSICASCMYRPGGSPEITTCPECGSTEFAVLVESATVLQHAALTVRECGSFYVLNTRLRWALTMFVALCTLIRIALVV